MTTLLYNHLITFDQEVCNTILPNVFWNRELIQASSRYRGYGGEFGTSSPAFTGPRLTSVPTVRLTINASSSRGKLSLAKALFFINRYVVEAILVYVPAP